MRHAGTWMVLGAAALTITACSGGQRRGPPTKVINRVLATAPGKAQPSAIVAREIEYANAEKAEGIGPAGARFAASGAIWHSASGPGDLGARGAPSPADSDDAEWSTRTVVMSCDGSLALTQGRFRDAQGQFGNYIFTWVRQSDNSYKWSYNTALRDDPQPPPRKQFEDGDIVVTAIDAVLGLVATCPRAGEAVPPPPAIPIGENDTGDAQLSDDGTLRWRWEHQGNGVRYVVAEYFYEGQWVTAIEEGLASPTE